MTKYNTGNPVGSADPRDRHDNSQAFDEGMNSENPNFNDRLGRARKSWQAFEDQVDQQQSEFDAEQADREQRFNNFIASSGYTGTGENGATENYAAGIEFTEYNQVLRDANGEIWRVSGATELPYITTGAGLPEAGAFVPVGDAVLRQELASPSPGKGASLIKMESGQNLEQAVSDRVQKENKTLINHLWPGEFVSWQRFPAGSVNAGKRVSACDGVTLAREDFSDGVMFEAVAGKLSPSAFRVQRIAGTSGASPVNVVMALTQKETSEIAGKTATMQFYARRSAGYSGSAVNAELMVNDGFEQAITSADGGYFENGEIVASLSEVLSESAPAVPFNVTAQVPAGAVQVAVRLSVDFLGVAGDEDWVEFEKVGLFEADRPVLNNYQDRVAIEAKGRSRYQGSYGKYQPKGTPTFNGCVAGVAVGANAVKGLVSNVRFCEQLALPPVFYFQSPTSGTESRLYHEESGNNINGLAYNLNDKGVQVRSNDAAVVQGDVYLFHWVAEVNI